MAKSKKANNKKAAKPAAKPAAKKVSKPAPKAKAKVVAKPAAKKSAKPAAKAKSKSVVKKAAKPAPKKVVKKAAPAKKLAKPAPKKVVKKAAPAKKVVKPTPKKVVKKAVPVKKVAKPAPKKVVKKAAPAKKVVAKKAAPAPKKVVAKPVPAKKAAPAPAAKVAAKPVAAAPAKKVEAPVAQPAKPIVQIKSGPVKKHSNKKSSKPVETYDGKRVVRSELPAKALITLQKPEEEIRMEHTHYEFPTLRYSDAELKEFKEIIDKKLAAGREELKNLKDSLESHTESQVGNKSWNMEEGSDTSEMEYLMNQIARLNKFIRDLEMALVRIENKTYGICRATGKLIDKNRLRVVPHATLSMEAKMSRNTDDITNTSQAPAAHMGSEGEGFGGEE